jgi:hypothetical protein
MSGSSAILPSLLPTFVLDRDVIYFSSVWGTIPVAYCVLQVRSDKGLEQNPEHLFSQVSKRSSDGYHYECGFLNPCSYPVSERELCINQCTIRSRSLVDHTRGHKPSSVGME